MGDVSSGDLYKLPPETRAELESLVNDIDKAKHAIETLRKLGINTTDLEAKLTWAENVRETLLKEFS